MLGACAQLPDLLRLLASQAPAAVGLPVPTPGATASGPGATPPPDEPKQAEDLLNAFMSALLNPDEDAAAKAVMPYVHVSLLNSTKTDLTQDLRSFSFHKAWENARFYAVPVQVTRVRDDAETGIGFGSTAELGRMQSWFIAKKEGVAGLPAPIKVFFPTSGSPPRIAYMGSL